MPNRGSLGRAIAPQEDVITVVSVRMPPELRTRIERIAHDEERSTSWMTRRLLEQGTTLYEQLPRELLEWARTRPEGMAALLRRLLEEERNRAA